MSSECLSPAACSAPPVVQVQFYTNILTLGFNVWACDADTAWMAHPAPFVNEYPMQYVDILTTTDCIDVEGDTRGGCWHVDHNTGLVYMRARPEVCLGHSTPPTPTRTRHADA